MRAAVIAGIAGAVAAAPLHGHALFPARPVVETLGPQAWVTLKAINGREDVSEFVVETFDPEDWTPSRIAVASPERITVPAGRPGANPAVRNIRVLVQLRGEKQRQVLVCTRSVSRPLDPAQLDVNTRVCSRVTVKAWQ